MKKKPIPKKPKTSTLKKKAWKWFSIWLRLKYADHNGMVQCYTCPKVLYWKGDGMQAGHFSSGRGNAVLLDERQVRPQCYACNCGRSGEQYKFGKKLEKELGVKVVRELERKRFETRKITDQEWIDSAIYYKQEAEKIAVDKFIDIT